MRSPGAAELKVAVTFCPSPKTGLDEGLTGGAMAGGVPGLVGAGGRLGEGEGTAGVRGVGPPACGVGTDGVPAGWVAGSGWAAGLLGLGIAGAGRADVCDGGEEGDSPRSGPSRSVIISGSMAT